MGNIIWVLFEIYRSLQQQKNFANRSRIDKVITMVRVAHFFDSRCILNGMLARPTCRLSLSCINLTITINLTIVRKSSLIGPSK